MSAAFSAPPIAWQTLGLSLGDQQGLRSPADRALLVVKGSVGEPHTRALGDRDRLEADPLALGRADEVERQIDVDEDEAAVIERGADAVARIRRDRDALKRRGLLAGHE